MSFLRTSARAPGADWCAVIEGSAETEISTLDQRSSLPVLLSHTLVAQLLP